MKVSKSVMAVSRRSLFWFNQQEVVFSEPFGEGGCALTNSRQTLDDVSSPEKTELSLILVASLRCINLLLSVCKLLSSSRVSERCGAATATPGQWCSQPPAYPVCPWLGQISVANELEMSGSTIRESVKRVEAQDNKTICCR